MIAFVESCLVFYIVGRFLARAALPMQPPLPRFLFALVTGFLLLLLADFAVYLWRARKTS